MRKPVAIAVSLVLVLITGATAMAGILEQEAALTELNDVEAVVYVGNAGSIGAAPAHPSILFRLLDAKAKNDNSLIGSTDTLIEELSQVSQGVAALNAADNDFQAVQQLSVTRTGYTLTERLEFVETNLEAILVELPGSGINNDAQKQTAIARTTDAIIDVEAAITEVESHLSETATLSYGTECLDLETGTIFTEAFGCQNDQFLWEAYDFEINFEESWSNPTVLVQNQYGYPSWALISFLDGVPFSDVSAADIPLLVFSPDLVEVAFDNDDTIVLFTKEGNYFKIGNPICNTSGTEWPTCQNPATPLWTATFDYEQLVAMP